MTCWRRTWRTTMLALIVALTACVSAPPREPGTGAWVQGRLVVRIAATAQEAARSETAAFELQGDGDRGELRLSTPLGSQVAVATWAPGVALLTTPGSRSSFASLLELARQAFGEELPLQAMPEWLRGRPWANSGSTSVEGGFMQLGWRVDLTRFADGVLVAARDAPPAVTLRVQLDR